MAAPALGARLVLAPAFVARARLGRRRCRRLLDSIAGSQGCRLGTRRNPTARYRRLPADRIRTRHDRPPTPSPGAPIRAEPKRETWNLVGIACLSVLVLARSGRSFVRRECELLPMIRSSFPPSWTRSTPRARTTQRIGSAPRWHQRCRRRYRASYPRLTGSSDRRRAARSRCGTSRVGESLGSGRDPDDRLVAIGIVCISAVLAIEFVAKQSPTSRQADSS